MKAPLPGQKFITNVLRTDGLDSSLCTLIAGVVTIWRWFLFLFQFTVLCTDITGIYSRGRILTGLWCIRVGVDIACPIRQYSCICDSSDLLIDWPKLLLAIIIIPLRITLLFLNQLLMTVHYWYSPFILFIIVLWVVLLTIEPHHSLPHGRGVEAALAGHVLPRPGILPHVWLPEHVGIVERIDGPSSVVIYCCWDYCIDTCWRDMTTVISILYCNTNTCMGRQWPIIPWPDEPLAAWLLCDQTVLLLCQARKASNWRKQLTSYYMYTI